MKGDFVALRLGNVVEHPYNERMNAIARTGNRAAKIARALVPDPFAIAIVLATVVLLVGWAVGQGTDGSPLGLGALLSSFADGMLAPPMLAFAFQMALILVTGHALADAPPLRAGLAVIGAIPKSSASAAALVALVACSLGLLNWGLSLVGGAFLAREVGRAFARRKAQLNYPLVGAAGYLGMAVWHGGISGSAPLAVATPGTFGDAIPISETLFTARNLVITLALLVVLPILYYWLGKTNDDDTSALPRTSSPSPVAAEEQREVEEDELEGGRPAAFLERSSWVSWLLALPLLVGVLLSLFTLGGKAVSLNFIILAFFALGLMMNGSPLQYAKAFSDGAQGAAGILLQFPIYFGIMAMMRDAGLLVRLADAFASLSLALSAFIHPSVSSAWTTFCSAAVINVLVPSGGGQWALQAPIILQTAAKLGVPPGPLVMAFSYGDEVTNLLQPFWALPLLSITNLRARDVFGYTLLTMCVLVPIFLIGLALF